MLRTAQCLTPRIVRSCMHTRSGPSIPLQTLRLLSSGPEGLVIELHTDEAYENELKAAKGKGRLAVVDFTAKWCGPCKVMAPVYSQLASLYQDVKFLKADIDNQSLQKTVADNNIASVPTFVFFKDGQEKGKVSGADPYQLKKMLDELK